MKDIENNINEKSDYLFNNAFTDFNLDEDIDKIYEIVQNEDIQLQHEKDVNLSNIRNKNYKRYSDIDILKFKQLPDIFSDSTKDLLEYYNCINIKDLLTDNYEDAKNSEILIDNIYRKISIIDNMVNTYIKELTVENDKNQEKFSISYFKNLDIDKVLKRILIEKYNDLVIKGSSVTKDIYEELDIQLFRKKILGEIFKSLNIEEDNKLNNAMKDKLVILNEKIDSLILKHNNQIRYLEDIMKEHSKYEQEFIDFKEFYNKIIAYDDKSYDNATQTFEILSDDTRLRSYVTTFETLFINELSDTKKEQKFIFEKVGIKNLVKSLEYIKNNYASSLSEENLSIIQYIDEKIKEDTYDLADLNKALLLVVKRIWKNTITDIYSFDPTEDFYFICSNNQFIDQKYQTILITKKELQTVDNYEDYQIGFICKYNYNILYITENEDIMTVEDDDMSNLKTPLQLEEEFINFKVCDRIALDGYNTKIEGVYFIDDGNTIKRDKAIELANMYKLPLLIFKKEAK